MGMYLKRCIPKKIMEENMKKKMFLEKIKNSKKYESFYTVHNQFLFYLFAFGKEKNINSEKEICEFKKYINNFNQFHDVLMKYYVQAFQSNNDNDKFIGEDKENNTIKDLLNEFLDEKTKFNLNRKISDFKKKIKGLTKPNNYGNKEFKYLKEKHIDDSYLSQYSKLKSIYYRYYLDKLWKILNVNENEIETKIEKILSDNCFYCGITLKQIEKLSENLELFTRRCYYSNRGFVFEIDRKEPYKEYSPDNVVLSCYWCNNAKTDEFSAKEFRQTTGKAMRKIWNDRIKNVNEKLDLIPEPNHLVPDWNPPKSLVLVWPEGLYGKIGLIPFYSSLIEKLPKDLHLTLIIKRLDQTKAKEIQQLNTKIKIEFVEIPIVEDIWIRDWAPFLAKDECGNIVAAKMVYDPPYFEKEDKKYAASDNCAGYKIAEHFSYPINNYSLVWDGGNLTHNGMGCAILTNFIKQYNCEDKVENCLHSLNITEPEFIRPEPGDETGHVDGTIRFIDDKTLLVASYPENYYNDGNRISEEELVEASKYLNELATRFSKKFEVIRITNSIPRNSIRDNIPSAEGNYMNFLRLENTILLPQYGDIEDKAAYNKFTDIFGEDNVIKIEDDIDKLAKWGGVLNCISWLSY